MYYCCKKKKKKFSLCNRAKIVPLNVYGLCVNIYKVKIDNYFG